MEGLQACDNLRAGAIMTLSSSKKCVKDIGLNGTKKCPTGKVAMALTEVLEPYVVFRIDGGRRIGSGHIVRCATIAAELESMGVYSLAAVSTEESARLAESRGLRATVVGGNPIELGQDDAVELRPLMGNGCKAVVVDTYAAGDSFWHALGRLSNELGRPTSLIDDRYLFSEGMLKAPKKIPVDLVVSYGFDADAVAYESAYSGTTAHLLIGPRYAPVREGFKPAATTRRNRVNRIIVTSGSTNPNRVLERFCAACLAAVPGAAVDLVVGAAAEIDSTVASDGRVRVHQGLTNLAPLMARADLAISAAGSTLYELSCMGVPTVAVPIVENQLGNAQGFADRGCGLVSGFEDLATAVRVLADDWNLREGLATCARSFVDGRGAERIAHELLRLSGGGCGC